MRKEACFIELSARNRPSGPSFRCKTVKKEIKNENTNYELIIHHQNGKRYVLNGSYDTTVQDLKKQLGYPCEIIKLTNGQKERLKNDFKPFNELFFYYKNHLLRNPSCNLMITNIYPASAAFTNYLWINLRKLTICSIKVVKINLRELDKLKYLELCNLGLRKLIMPKHSLEYCNISANKLTKCMINSKVLIAKNNKIERFSSSFNFKHVDISCNPLRKLKISALSLNISDTCLKKLSCNTARKIIADRTKNIAFSSCPNLRYLSVNNCNLSVLTPEMAQVTVLRARNNQIDDLPLLPNIRYIDISCNLLSEFIMPAQLEAANISKNHIAALTIKPNFVIESLNASYNPMDELNLPYNFDQKDKKLYLDSRLCRKHSMEYQSIYKHTCRSNNKYFIKHEIKGYLCNKFVKFVVYLATNADVNINFQEIWENIGSFDTTVEFLELFSLKVMPILRSCDLSSSGLFVLITDESILLKSWDFQAIFFNFIECRRIGQTNTVWTFVNILRWSVVPLFCHLEPGNEAEYHKINTRFPNFWEIFQFIDYFCPLALKFILINSSDHLSNTGPIGQKFLIKTVKLEKKEIPDMSFDEMYKQYGFRVWEPCSKYLGCSNIDFGMNIYKDQQLNTSSNSSVDASLVSTSMPVFVFLKLAYGQTDNPILKAEKYNALNIIDTLCKLFCGRYIEKNYMFYVVVFESVVFAALWGLRLKTVLGSIGITIGVGITGDTILRTQSGGNLRFGGPAFNKSSRMADAGTGVFCSSFLNITHPMIECIDEGECYIRGFSEKERILSLHIKNKGRYWPG